MKKPRPMDEPWLDGPLATMNGLYFHRMLGLTPEGLGRGVYILKSRYPPDLLVSIDFECMRTTNKGTVARHFRINEIGIPRYGRHTPADHPSCS